jgi:hypothetical protein
MLANGGIIEHGMVNYYPKKAADVRIVLLIGRARKKTKSTSKRLIVSIYKKYRPNWSGIFCIWTQSEALASAFGKHNEI